MSTRLATVAWNATYNLIQTMLTFATIPIASFAHNAQQGTFYKTAPIALTPAARTSIKSMDSTTTRTAG